MKSRGNSNGLLATDSGPQPGDFPLGSVESRAAARAKLRRSPYDSDCAEVYNFAMLCKFAIGEFLNEREVEETNVFKRGEEIEVPKGTEEYWRIEKPMGNFVRCFTAFNQFYYLHEERVPVSGDTLSYKEIEERHPDGRWEGWLREYQAAWARRLPQFPFPAKFEDGKVLLLSAESKRGKEVWVEESEDRGLGVFDNHLQIWARIEAEAMGKGRSRPPRLEKPTMQAIIFRQNEDGRFYTEPLKTSRVRS